MNDWELLQAWADRRSDDAFAQIVHRYLGLVYSSARRQVNDSSMAEDVAQAVFLLLARKASSLNREVILPSWLFRTTRFVATRALRAEQRRRSREYQAAAMNPGDTLESAENSWTAIKPHLDAAVASLSSIDRDAIVMRFFQRKPLREVGEALGVSEEAAKKRVGRAVEKLRERLKQHSGSLTGTALATLLATSPAEAVPASLAPTIQAAVVGVASSSEAVSPLVEGAARDWIWLRCRSWVPWAVASVLVGVMTGVWLNSFQKQEALAENDREAVSPAVASPNTTLASFSSEGTGASPASRQLHLTVLAEEDSLPLADVRLLAGVSSRSWATTRLTSDSSGTFSVSVPAADFRYLRVWLSAPGRVPKVMTWRGYEFTEPVLFHTSRLERGLRFSGEVRDETGRPIVGARLELNALMTEYPRRENIGFNAQLLPVLSDDQGGFETDQMPAQFGDHGIQVTVVHPDFAYGKFNLSDPSQLSVPQIIVLRSGVPLSGRVVADDGTPIADAEVDADPWRAGPAPKTRTDGEGRFEFAHLAVGTTSLRVQAEGYRSRERTVVTDTNSTEVVLELQPSFPAPPGDPQETAPSKFRLAGTVVDHETDAPIMNFRVFAQSSSSVPALMGEGRDGAFSWTLDPNEIEPSFAVIVSADGYLPERLGKFDAGSIQGSIPFRLQRDSGLSGWVYQPDGQPAAAAEVSLAGDDFGLLLSRSGSLINAGNPVHRVLADNRGHFVLEPQVGTLRVAIVHPSGCLVVPATAATNGALRLESWGEIEGTVLAGGRPVAGAQVTVGFTSPSYGPDDLRLDFDYVATTDARGEFRFVKVPPGQHYVQRMFAPRAGKSGPTGSSYGEPVTVEPGKTAQVTLGGKGRAVIGRLELSPPLAGYNWNWDLPALVLERPDLERPSVRSAPTADARTRRLEQFAWAADNLARKKYYFVVQPDGTFQADDVPPGNYLLDITVKAPPADPLSEEWDWSRSRLGQTTRQVVVPEPDSEGSAEPVEVGTVTVRLRGVNESSRE